MVAVPYNPVPGQALQDIPTPEMRPNIPRAAFGGDVAEATQMLGKSISGVGDETFSVAMKLQDLANRAEVDKADSEYMKQAGLLHADFTAKKGLDAKEAFPKYQQDLEAARQNIRSGIKSPAAQKMYDSSTLSTLGRTIFNGAGHAGTEVASASRQNTQDRINTLVATGGNNADPKIVEDSRKKAVGLTHQLYKDLGRPEAAADAEVIVNSSIAANHIQFLAKDGQLDQAEKKFAALDPEKMTKEDLERTRNVIQTLRHSQGAGAIVDTIVTGAMDTDGTLKVPVAELQKQARDLARKQAPKDETYANLVVARLDARLNQDSFASKRALGDNRQIVAGAIQNGAKNLDELLKDPKAAAAYWQLPKAEQNKVPLQIYGYIRDRDRQSNDAMMERLNGMKNNNTEEFLNFNEMDPDHGLSHSNRMQIQSWKERIKKQPGGDPRVDRAMGWLRASNGSTMSVLVNGRPDGPLRRTDRNAADYDRLTGTMQAALDLWLENKGKPPTNKEFNEQIAPELLKTHTEPGFFGMTFGGNKYSTFKPNTSSDDYKKITNSIKEDFKAKGLEEPTEIELEKAYTRTQLLKVFPPKTSDPRIIRSGP